GVKYMEPDGVQLSPGEHGAIFSIDSVTPSSFYRNQPALQRVRLPEASQRATGRGIVVADINALVDVAHPALIGHLTSGAQFLHGNCRNRSSLNASSGAFMDSSSGAFMDSSSGAFMDSSSGAFMDSSSGAFMDSSSAAFIDAVSPAHG